jgi:hypothetical protein
MLAAANSLTLLRAQGGTTATARWGSHSQSGYAPSNASQPQWHPATTAPAFAASSPHTRAPTETAPTQKAVQLDRFSPRNFEDVVASIKSCALKSTDSTGHFLVHTLDQIGFGLAATSKSIREVEAKDKKEGTQTSSYYRAVDLDLEEEAKVNDEEAENSEEEAEEADNEDDALASAFAQIENPDKTNGDIKSKIRRHYRDLNERMNGKGGGKARLKAIQQANVTNRTITVAWRQLQDCAELELRRIISLHMSKDLFEMAMRATGENAFKAMTWIRNKVYRDKKHAEREAMDTIRNAANLHGLTPEHMLIAGENQLTRYKNEMRRVTSKHETIQAKMENATTILNQKLIKALMGFPALSNAVETFLVNTNLEITKSYVPPLRTILLKLDQAKAMTHQPPALGMLAGADTRTAPGNFGRGMASAPTSSTTNAPHGLTNQLPHGLIPKMTDDQAWRSINDGRGPGQPRVFGTRKDGSQKPATAKRAQMLDIEEKLMLQGAAASDAARIAGEHIVGTSWMPAEEWDKRLREKRNSGGDYGSPKKKHKPNKALLEQVGKLEKAIVALQAKVD